MTSYALLSAIDMGLIYSLVALGVFLSFRILNFPDLTVEGSFPLGAAVSASLLTHGFSPILATLLSIACGALSGMLTAFLHKQLKIMGLLASILTMTALYSINIRIMGDKPNLGLLNLPTLFTEFNTTLLLSVIVILSLLKLIYFFKTEIGLSTRASGMNPQLSEAYRISNTHSLFLILASSNALVALAGALFAQSQGFADVSLGTGTIVSGLAAVIIGETLVGSKTLSRALCACVVGALTYRLLIAFALTLDDLGLHASDLNLITTGIIVLMLCLARKFR